MMKDSVIINVIGASVISPDTYDDLIEILADVPAIDDIADTAGDADISLVVFPGRNDDGRIWKGRSMTKGSSRTPGLPHMINPIIPDGMTSEDIGICDDILYFYPEELRIMEECCSESTALCYAKAELYQLIVQYLYAGTEAVDIYEESMSLFDQLKEEILKDGK